MRQRKGHLWNLVLLFLIIMLFSELFLPGIAERKLTAILQKETDGIEDIEIKLATFPSLKVIIGQINYAELMATGVVIENLRLEHLDLKYRDVKLKSGSFTGENTTLDIIIIESDINQYIKDRYPELADFKIKLLPEQAILNGSINFFDTGIKIQLSGELDITEEKKIVFIPINFQIEEVNIPVNLVKRYINDLGFSFDLKNLTIPLNMKKIDIREGQIRVLGGSEFK